MSAHWEDFTPEAAAQHGYAIHPDATVADFRAAGWTDCEMVEQGIIRGPVPERTAPKAHPLTTDQLEYVKQCRRDIGRMIESLHTINRAAPANNLDRVLMHAVELHITLAEVGQ